MALGKKKKGKKDDLKGAMDQEMSSGGIMGDFVKNVNKDNSKGKGSSEKPEETGGFLESIKSLAKRGEQDKDDYSGNYPMIRNRTPREWWISSGAFLVVLLLVFFLFFGFAGGNKYQLYLSSTAIDNYTYGSAEASEFFETNRPIYVYFAAKKKMKTNKVSIKIVNLSHSSADSNLSIIESNINPNWKIVETHFQKEFFESPGKYKIIISNEKKKTLIEKTFTVR